MIKTLKGLNFFTDPKPKQIVLCELCSQEVDTGAGGGLCFSCLSYQGWKRDQERSQRKADKQKRVDSLIDQIPYLISLLEPQTNNGHKE